MVPPDRRHGSAGPRPVPDPRRVAAPRSTAFATMQAPTRHVHHHAGPMAPLEARGEHHAPDPEAQDAIDRARPGPAGGVHLAPESRGRPRDPDGPGWRGEDAIGLGGRPPSGDGGRSLPRRRDLRGSLRARPPLGDPAGDRAGPARAGGREAGKLDAPHDHPHEPRHRCHDHRAGDRRTARRRRHPPGGRAAQLPRLRREHLQAQGRERHRAVPLRDLTARSHRPPDPPGLPLRLVAASRTELRVLLQQELRPGPGVRIHGSQPPATGRRVRARHEDRLERRATDLALRGHRPVAYASDVTGISVLPNQEFRAEYAHPVR